MQGMLNAAAEGDAAAVSRLLAAGANPNASMAVQPPSGEVHQDTALIIAAGYGQLEAARLLLDAGAEPSLANSLGSTPLMIAAQMGQLEMLRLLPKWGAAVDAVDPRDGGTAFHSACYHNQPDCVEALARVGCDVGIKDNDGLTGREIAARKGHAAVVARLRAVVTEQLRVAQAAARAAPEPEPAAAAGDGEPAHLLLMAALEGDGVAVARLLAAGADPNALVAGQPPWGRCGVTFYSTALCAAAEQGHLEAARLLLDASADPGLVDSDGCTSLMIAAEQGQLEVLRLLLARGAAMDAAEPSRGYTAFHYACYTGQAECAEALVRAGCDVGIKGDCGKTGREIAEEEEYDELAAWLCEVEAERGGSGGGGGGGRGGGGGCEGGGRAGSGAGGGAAGGGTSGAKKKRKKRPKKKRTVDPAAEPEPEPEPDDLEPEPEAPSGPMAAFDEAVVLAWLGTVPGLTAEQRAAALERVAAEEYDGKELAAVKPKRLMKLLKGSEAEEAVPLLLAARDALLAAEEAARTIAAAAATAVAIATAEAATAAAIATAEVAAVAAAAAATVPEPAPAAAAERPSCSICMEPYSAAGGVVPRMLVACGHDFCEGCLNEMLRCAAANRSIVCLRTRLHEP
jgi:ankyrin repeat protein